MPKSNSIVKIKVLYQGAMLINKAIVYKGGRDIVSIAIDMKSKRGEIFADGVENDCPTIAVVAVKSSVNLKPKTPKYTPTDIMLPEFKGWSVWCSEVGRYTIRLCLIKSSNNKTKK